MPRSTSGIEKRVDSAAIRRSHAAANTTPPPTQCPWTAAIVTACIASIASAISRPASAASRGRVPAGSPKLARSAPALKARPAPCTITTRTSSRVSNQSAAATSSRRHVVDNGFSCAGRFNWMWPIVSSTDTARVLKFAMTRRCHAWRGGIDPCTRLRRGFGSGVGNHEESWHHFHRSGPGWSRLP